MQSLFQSIYDHPGLTQEELQTIMDAHERVSFSKGELVLKSGRMPNEYYILETGVMRSFVYDYVRNDITTRFFVDRNIVIEEASLFQRQPSRESIEALSDCQCWEMRLDKFQELYHSIKSLNEWGRAWMSGKLFEFKQRSVEMITERASDRYLNLMKEMPAVLQNAPLKTIATYLGITDSSLSRIRKELSSG